MQSSRALITIAVLATIAACELRAQVDSIVPNPKAVELRRIWVQGGERESRASYGQGIAACGDINGDTLADFAVWSGVPPGFRVFYGGSPAPSDSVAYYFRTQGVRPSLMVVGDFYGTSHRALAFPNDTCDSNGTCLYRLFIFRTDRGVIDSLPANIIDTKIQFCPRELAAADLDNDQTDDLVLVRACTFPEIWIYKGGKDMRGDTPTVKIGDYEQVNSNFAARIADFDGDGNTDAMLTGIYSGVIKIKIFWGDGTIDGWRRSSREIILTGDRHAHIGFGPTVLDCDGDRIADLVFPGPNEHTYVYRTRGTGKSVRTRTFELVDADAGFREGGVITNAGFIADSLLGAEAIGLAKYEFKLLTGGSDGPDNTYEARYAYADGGGFLRVISIGDCNGDGWDDVLAGDGNFGWMNQGIAAVFAGGPYIPADDTAAGVRQYELEGKPRGISVWPNPMRDELNIAWRGDLRAMPRRFAVHDLTGQLVAKGEVPAGAGAAIWRSSRQIPPGAYIISMYAKDDSNLASVLVIKQ